MRTVLVVQVVICVKGKCHEIIFAQFFSLMISFRPYQRYYMRILNFGEFSLCLSTVRETRRCRLHRWVQTLHCRLHRQVWTPRCSVHWWVQTTGAAYTVESTISSSSQKLIGVGYTGVLGLTGVAYNGESGLSGLTYSGDSLVKPLQPANFLKGTITQKVDCEC
jgi:hypothetical protein